MEFAQAQIAHYWDGNKPQGVSRMRVFFERRLNREAELVFPNQVGKFKIDDVNRLLRRHRLPLMSKLPLASNPFFPFDVNDPAKGGVVVVLGPQEPRNPANA